MSAENGEIFVYRQLGFVQAITLHAVWVWLLRRCNHNNIKATIPSMLVLMISREKSKRLQLRVLLLLQGP